MQRVAGLGDGERDLQRLVHDAVGIDEGLGAVDAVGDGGDVRAHQLAPRAARISPIAVDHGVVAVAVEQLGQPPLADLQRRRLRLDVADALVGDADVGGDDRVDLADPSRRA